MKRCVLLILLLTISVLFAESISIVDRVGGFTNAQSCGGQSGVVYILDHWKVMSYDQSGGSFLDTLDLGEYVREIAFSGSQAVVVGISEIHLIDISDPSNLIELDNVDFSGTSGWDVDIAGDMVYVAVQNKVAFYQISGMAFTFAGNYYPSGSFPMARAVAVRDSIMYVGLGDAGIAAVNVENPLSPSLRAMADTPGATIDLDIAPGDILICSDGAYVGYDTTSIQFYQIPNPAAIGYIGVWSQPGGGCRKSDISGNRLALADGEGGVRVLDFLIPSTPYEVVHQPTGSDIKGVFVSGDTIFAAGADTFYVMITDAFAPDTGYIAGVIDGVSPESVTVNACDPEFVWYFTCGTFPVDPASAVVLANGISYSVSDSELTVTPGPAGNVTLNLDIASFTTGDTIEAYISELADTAGHDFTGSMLGATIIIDYSPPALSDESPAPWDSVNPDSVIITGRLEDVGSGGFVEDSFRVFIDGVSYSPAGMYLDYSAPNFTCTPMTSFSDGDTVEVCIHAVDGVTPENCGPNVTDTCWYFAVVGTGIGERVLPEELTLKASPNPFNSAVRISVTSPVEIEIFDIAGQAIERISGQSGKHEFIWTPNESLGSGIYFIKAQTDGATLAQKIVYLR